MHLEMNDAQPIISISVYSLNGQLIFNQHAPDVKGVDMSSFSPGLYFIRAQTSTAVYTRKVIKE